MPHNTLSTVDRLLVAARVALALSALVMAASAAWTILDVWGPQPGPGSVGAWALMAAAGALLLALKRLDARRHRAAHDMRRGEGEESPTAMPSIGSIGSLVAWLRLRPREESDLAGVLTDVATVLGGDRVAMAWECREEPSLQVAWLEDGEPRFRSEPPGALGTIVEPALVDADFACDDLLAVPRRLRERFSPSVAEWAGPIVDAAVTERFKATAVASWRLNGHAIEGRLFLFDRPTVGPHEMRVGTVAADVLAAMLDALYLVEQARERAVADERLRLARELHDGVVQSLTGIALQLRVLGQYLLDDRAVTERRLKEIEGLVSAEQRSLRSFVKLLRVPQPVAVTQSTDDLRERLDLAAARAAMQWGLQVAVTVRGAQRALSLATGQDVERLVTEALVNVGRHAGGSSAQVEVTCFDQHIIIAVADNGRGFPFSGRYGHEDLRAMNIGPLSLRQRAVSLGGSLTIESSHRGARLEFMLPLVAKTA